MDFLKVFESSQAQVVDSRNGASQVAIQVLGLATIALLFVLTVMALL